MWSLYIVCLFKANCYSYAVVIDVVVVHSLFVSLRILLFVRGFDIWMLPFIACYMANYAIRTTL